MTVMPDEYYAGYKARSDNLKRSDNPYHIDENDQAAFKQRDSHILWRNGWDDKDAEIFAVMHEAFEQVHHEPNKTNQLVLVPLPTITKLYELASQAEYESNTGLCFNCGAAVSPVYNKEHEPDCVWLTTIEEIETLLDKEI
jgi:hypothetical protein